MTKEVIDSKVIIHIAENETIKLEALLEKNYNYEIHVARNATVNFIDVNLEATENFLNVYLEGEGAAFYAESLTIASTDKYSFKQEINHLAKYTCSNITNFAISLNNSEVTYKTSGKITNGNSKSKCMQLSKGVIMSDDSKISSMPILLIDEYDVVANHGASIGKMSDDELFYLMSRGLNKKEALMLIIYGLIDPIINQISDEKKKNEIKDLIDLKISGD